MIKAIIFDFDGVLADSFDCLYFLIKDAMAQVGIKISQKKYRNLFQKNIHQGFKDYINNQKKYKEFSKFRRANYRHYYRPGLFLGVFKILNKLSKKYFLAIASSGQQSNIINLLKKHNLDNLFSLILANRTYSKNKMLKKILDKSDTKAEEALMITDTLGDLEIAKQNGLKTMAVTWGFQTKKTLRSAKPDFMVDSFREMLKLLVS